MSTQRVSVQERTGARQLVRACMTSMVLCAERREARSVRVAHHSNDFFHEIFLPKGRSHLRNGGIELVSKLAFALRLVL